MIGKRVGLVALLGMLMASLSWSGEVLIVADEWPQMEVLGKFIAEGGYPPVKVKQDEMPADLSSYSGVIEFVHGAFNDEPARKMRNYAEQGGRLIVLHHGISSKKAATPGWLPFLGMKLERAEGAPDRYVWIYNSTLNMVNLNPHHYITSNSIHYATEAWYKSSDAPSEGGTYPALLFENTEVFLHHQFTDGREKTVLFGLRYREPNSQTLYMEDRAGWYKPAGRGWVFYFQPGHAVTDFENPNYCQIILNCLTWKP